MALSINTNVGMMNLRDNLRVTSGSAGRSMERLATGMSINSAADNPSGVALSQKMTAKIRGTSVSSQNAQDAFNFLKLRSDADTQVRDIILRLRDMAVHAANEATMTAEARTALSTEASSLIDQMSQINASVTFNGKKVYDISFDTVDGGNFGFYNGGIKTISINLAGIYAATGNTPVTLRFAWFNGDADFPDANLLSPDGTEAFGYLYGTAPGPQTVESYVSGFAPATANNGQADDFGIGTMNSAASINYGGYVGTSMGAPPDAYVEENFTIDNPAAGLWTIIIDNQSATPREYGIFVNEPSRAPIDTDHVQIGPDNAASNRIQIGFYEVTSLALGVSADFSSVTGAQASITSLDASLDKLSEHMGTDGVNMNNILKIISGNEQQIAGMSAARSRISDANLAAEVTGFTTAQIRAQGSVAMATQALNMPAQRVLSLLSL